MDLDTVLSQFTLWDRLDAAGARLAARALEEHLPKPWRFVRVEGHAAGDQGRSVAFFDGNGAEFALIPGGDVLLGYDPSRPPDLTAEDREDWDAARPEYGEFEDHLRLTMTPPRRVQIRPFLLEVDSREMDGEPVRDSGRVVGRRSLAIPVGQVREWAHADGFSPPTSDQWEHACRAGSRTFWWWGNGLTFPLPERNAFGLRIARDTYRFEWCTAPDVYRGGDGGVSCCGGLDGLPTTLRLASAYFEPFPIDDGDSASFVGDCRRAFPLPEFG